MNIDERFPTKLDAIQDAPEPFLKALLESFPAKDSVRFLVHAPLFSTADERSSATVLAVTGEGWLVASETEAGGVSIQKSNFRDTLFLELTSILLWGQSKIHFVTASKSDIAILRFDTVGEELYRDAIDHVYADCAANRLPIEPARTIRYSCFPSACNARRRRTGDHLPR